jgi:hypothetical protein
MENDRTAASGLGLAAICLLLAALPVRGADAPPCDDCKFLPCVEKQLAQYKEVRRMYREEVSKASDTAEYDKLVKDKVDPIVDRYSKELAAIPACKLNFPEGLATGDLSTMSRWRALGWGYREVEPGQVSVIWTAVTSMADCKLREDQLEKSREIVACVDLAEATEKHEREHVKQCIAQKAEIKKHPEKAKELDSPRAHALFEVGGYDAGIKRLEKTYKRIKDKRCPRPQPSHMRGAKAHDAMKKTIGASGERLMMYAAAKAR